MFVTKDRPGALVDVLADFQSSGLNLSHIDKRPSGRENWEYTFFVDVLPTEMPTPCSWPSKKPASIV